MTIEGPTLHKLQRVIRDSDARFRVLACGRRWGKSRLASALMTETALWRGVCWIVAPSYATGNPLFDDLRRLANQIPGCEVNRSERLIRYPSGGTCQVKSADDPALLRGVSLDLCVFDEAGYIPKLEELFLEVIRPALADRRGKAIFCSTPNGKNYFYALYQMGLDPLQTDWASWQLPTASNPYIDGKEIESARGQLSERQFSQEFLAEFADSGSVFRNIRESATAQPQPGPLDGHSYTAGVDWGRSGDYTVVTIYDTVTHCVAFLDRFTGLPFDVQLNRVAAALERWQPWVTVCELNSFGQALFESLQKRELPTRLIGFTTSNQSKGALVDSFALALERRAITLLNDPLLIGELQAYQAETTVTGLIRYGAPVGQHDDCVMSLLLAYAPASEQGQWAPVAKTTSQISVSRTEIEQDYFSEDSHRDAYLSDLARLLH